MADALSNLLHDVRPRGALFDQSYLRSPWSLRFEERAPLTVATVLHGEAWITADGDMPVALEPGAVVIVVGAEPYTISDTPDTPAQFVVDDGGRCTGPDGTVTGAASTVCSHEVEADTSAALLRGTYQVQGSVCDRVLRGLPRVLVVPASAVPHNLVDTIVAELARPRAGQQAVLDRLLDLLLVSGLREWLDRPDSGAPPWYRAQDDVVVGTALRLMHDDPSHPWTVAALAERTAVSRATFARRFTDLVGEPPMSYLGCWRLCLAADLLRETDATTDAIARQVGYADADALAVAFKRTYGQRPALYRRLAL